MHKINTRDVGNIKSGVPCYNYLTQYRKRTGFLLQKQICVKTKDIKYIIGSRINVWSYLEEVETYDFVVIGVQGVKCLCRQNTKMIIHLNSSEMHVFKPLPLNSSGITPHYSSPWTSQPKCTNKRVHVVRLKTRKMTLTVHGLQSDQTGDKVVKVYAHVFLRVAQDDQLEQVVIQLKTWKRNEQNAWHSLLHSKMSKCTGVFCF